MRQFIRHPSDIPIEIQCAPDGRYIQRSTQNVSYGGLAFSSATAIELDTVIGLRMPHLRPALDLPAARVAWCRQEGGSFAVGVQFLDAAEAFQVRMVEQSVTSRVTGVMSSNARAGSSQLRKRRKSGSVATHRHSRIPDGRALRSTTWLARARVASVGR